MRSDMIHQYADAMPAWADELIYRPDEHHAADDVVVFEGARQTLKIVDTDFRSYRTIPIDLRLQEWCHRDGGRSGVGVLFPPEWPTVLTIEDARLLATTLLTMIGRVGGGEPA